MLNPTKRILVVDDNEAIHEDIHSILSPLQDTKKDSEKEMLEKELFGSLDSSEIGTQGNINYQIDDAYQGLEAIKMVDKAALEGNPYALVLMDVRMPPGIDGIQAVTEIWKKHPQTEIVICTAYSDYSWDQIVERVGSTDQLLFMKKPFDSIALKQIALSLTEKWEKGQKNREYVEKLETEIEQRTDQLEHMVKHLQELKNQSEELTIAKNNYFSSISSDLQTPLNGILGITDLLLDTDLNEEQKNIAETIKVSGNSLLLVINDILNQTKLEPDQEESSAISFDFRNTLENVIDLVSIAALEREIEIACVVDCRVDEFLIGDPFKLRKVLLLCLTQEIKSSRSTDIVISVDKTSDDDSKSAELRFNIYRLSKEKDDYLRRKQVLPPNKHGILPAIDSQLFSSEQKEIEKLVKELGGLYRFDDSGDNTNGHWFTGEFLIKEKTVFPSLNLSSTIIGMRCLVVSDYSTGRKVLSLHINHWGGICKEATALDDIAEKVYLAAESGLAYDCIIIDLKDEDLSFYEKLAKDILTPSEGKNQVSPKLICITAKANRGDALKIKEYGYSVYLSKPIKQSQLYKSLLLVKSLKDENKQVDPSMLITKHYVDEFRPDFYKALIIGRQEDHLKELITVLTRLKVRCDVSENREIAVPTVEKKNYDLLIIDCKQHDSAEEVFLESFINSAKDALPIILIEPDDNAMQEFLKKKGIEAFLSKPIISQKLIQLLHETLQPRV